MEDLPVSSSPISPEEQDRIRRERRHAKLKEGSSRLNRITGAQGQTFCIEETPAAREATPDPPDLDISADYYKPKTRQQGPPPSPLRSSSLANAQGQQGPLSGSGGPDVLDDAAAYGLCGRTWSDGWRSWSDGWFGRPKRSGDGDGYTSSRDSTNAAEGGPWEKALHVLSSLCLGGWVLLGTGWSFNGSALERAKSADMITEEAPPLFWYFTTMELVLQSS
ncbi:hypothetical protein B9Z19DRAFT_1134100 [Tuber borchii]|uniref:Uncharacterized protein n=1 Tax=Tuber borchii TaxID=42251 RepID=A0A2T6ZEM7_TUBBO|nr:hypothetical protein B9Z19DRAFT_1134100 [Tuber borchii]